MDTGASRTPRLLAAAVVLLVVLVVGGAGTAGAQDDGSRNEVPTQDIVPKPNSGEAPDEAGDRGGALQLLLPALIVAAIGGGVWHVSRQARRAQPSAMARQAGSPSRKPLR